MMGLLLLTHFYKIVKTLLSLCLFTERKNPTINIARPVSTGSGNDTCGEEKLRKAPQRQFSVSDLLQSNGKREAIRSN